MHHLQPGINTDIGIHAHTACVYCLLVPSLSVTSPGLAVWHCGRFGDFKGLLTC
jgi:hypothetical protein